MTFSAASPKWRGRGGVCPRHAAPSQLLPSQNISRISELANSLPALWIVHYELCIEKVLLLMEYGLGLSHGCGHGAKSSNSLNPSFNGIWSRTHCSYSNWWNLPRTVLILLLMEYGLGRSISVGGSQQNVSSLNPSFNGIWSRTIKYISLWDRY